MSELKKKTTDIKKKFAVKEFHILLFPPVFWLVLFFVIPLILVIMYSFSTKGVHGGVELNFSLNNYREIFQGLYLKVLLQSFWYALVATILTLSLAYPIAYYMAFAPPKIKMLIMFLIILPFWTNFLIKMYALMTILGDSGLINSALMGMGLIKNPLPMMNNTFAVFVGFVYWNLPFMVLPIFSSLDRMDVSLLEASMDLGASRGQTFRKIILPYSLPGLVAGIIFCFVPTMGNFVIPDLLGGTNNFMIGNVITSQFIQARNWPFGSALSMLLIFSVMICISLYLRYYNPSKNKNVVVM
ncbi:MAG: ABC transporter permease [Candidatus Cloacimonetes bacterium]|nr:ABC transporter permease [Candidatus Cloacimonadota bacterium]